MVAVFLRHPDATLQQALRDMDAGRDAEATEACRQLIAGAPDRPMAYALLSRLLLRAGAVRAATFHASMAGERIAGSPWQDVLAVSDALRLVGEAQQAHAVLAHVEVPAEGGGPRLFALGRQYAALDDMANGRRCLELARSRGMDGWLASHDLGRVLERCGESVRALAAFEDSVAQNPRFGAGHLACAQAGHRDGAAARAVRVRAALAVPGNDAEDTAQLQMALFHELDSTGDTAGAWDALMAGATARRLRVPYDARREAACVDALIGSTSRYWLARATAAPRDTTPVFVVGLPCDGAAALLRCLGDVPGLATGSDADDLAAQLQWHANRRLGADADRQLGDNVTAIDHVALGRRYLDKTRWRAAGRPVFLDRNPANFLYCGSILKAMPHARILHLRQHPAQACFDALRTSYAPGTHAWSNALDDLAAHHANYRRLMAHWHAIAPGRILDVRLEDLAAQPAGEAARVLEFIGLPHGAGGTDVRRDMPTADWRRYSDRLAPLLDRLGAACAEYGAASDTTPVTARNAGSARRETVRSIAHRARELAVS